MSYKQSKTLPLFDLPNEDIERIHNLLYSESWSELAGKSIFLTGGTGFIGKWIIASLVDANERFGLGCTITVLSRNPAALISSWPSLYGCVTWIKGDIRDFPIDNEHFDVIIHAATDVTKNIDSSLVFSTCFEGTRRVLELAKRCSASKILLLSSGAIYGPLSTGMARVPENYLGAPDHLQRNTAYAEGKRVSEWLVSNAASSTLEVKIARIFALVGPHLALDKQFAIGNFLYSAMTGKEIVIEGDGTPFRSYIYAADMTAWLWAILFRGVSGRAYNVGSEEGISILSLANRVCNVLGLKPRITVKKKSKLSTAQSYYVPDTSRSRKELVLPMAMELDQAILRTARWHSNRLLK